MRTCLLKSSLSLLSDYRDDKSFDVTLQNKESNEALIRISKGKIEIIVGSKEQEMYIAVNDINDISFGDDWKIVSFKEKSYNKSGEELENHFSHITNENFYIVKLMKIFGDKFNLLIKANGVFYNAYHVDSKVNFVEEQENNTLAIRSDSLYKLALSYNEFEVMSISPSINKLSYNDYMDIQMSKAQKLNKTVRR